MKFKTFQECVDGQITEQQIEYPMANGNLPMWAFDITPRPGYGFEELLPAFHRVHEFVQLRCAGIHKLINAPSYKSPKNGWWLCLESDEDARLFKRLIHGL